MVVVGVVLVVAVVVTVVEGAKTSKGISTDANAPGKLPNPLEKKGCPNVSSQL